MKPGLASNANGIKVRLFVHFATGCENGDSQQAAFGVTIRKMGNIA